MQRVPASSHSYNISFSFSVLSIWLGVKLLFCEISCAHSASQTDTNVNNLHTFTGKRIVLFEDGAKHKTQLRLVCSHTIFNAITDLSPLLIESCFFESTNLFLYEIIYENSTKIIFSFLTVSARTLFGC